MPWMQPLKKKKKVIIGGPWWLSRLRIQHCHCHGSGYFCGLGSVPGPETSICHGHSKKKKKKKKKKEEEEKNVLTERMKPATYSTQIPLWPDRWGTPAQATSCQILPIICTNNQLMKGGFRGRGDHTG